MFSLTIREQTLIAAVLLAAVGGFTIQHLRTRTDEVTVPVKKRHSAARATTH